MLAISKGSTSMLWSYEAIIATSVDVSFTDASNLSFEASEGLTTSRPPSLTERESRSLITFEQGGWLVSEGMKIWWMAFSKVWKRSLTSGMVLDRYDNRLESP